MKKRFFLVGVIIWLIVLGLFCTSRQVASNRPGWVDKGTGYFSGERGKAFYGVGAATNIMNVSLKRKTADANARASLAAIFSTKIKELVKNYVKSISKGVGENIRITEEQFAQSATKAFTEMELSGAIIIDRYFDSVEKTQYSLAVLDLSLFKDKVKEMKNLSQEVQNVIEQNAEKAFNELEEESLKK